MLSPLLGVDTHGRLHRFIHSCRNNLDRNRMHLSLESKWPLPLRAEVITLIVATGHLAPCKPGVFSFSNGRSILPYQAENSPNSGKAMKTQVHSDQCGSIEHRPADRKVADLRQGTCLGCGPGPQLGAYERQLVSVSLAH